ncbi:MAG: hypothetical protein A2087_11140 [Spirochaetes bacterium GWD1_61_31]|nr:MAG: hypothetical protein A2Y37_09910 [Spirochaetes bacterium GWB1_60_80]OHD34353.1 MAG: hypothetical protein A2004_07825 [Spirochaetes bacterium GWC1_61_12]OHD43130.1 MAG: hypothetical protein A2087_11140 [Spirochaetes bacterium GWD1_61_31]OHD44264.1 MAG: hypothetical protein A2Y35_06935 [Spirochaetes bacterium GWE1_60_18]OHD60376.1 MAG: hypothetical protein A2Y32_00590 [Spirochaetes bacterium GWF1_60_12]HAP43313.1 hypothetical protein [Spirochaetaceae bacterium]
MQAQRKPTTWATRILTACLGLILAASFGCAKPAADGTTGSDSSAPGASANISPERALRLTRKFGLVVGFGGLNDRAFNDLHFNGMVQARKDYGIEFEYRVPVDENDFSSPMQELIDGGCTVIIAGAGFFMMDAVASMAERYPDIIFILDDTEAIAYPPNVSSITYRQNEGSFMAGALAALISSSGKVATLGAMNVPVINDFMVGFAAGARQAVPEIVVMEDYIHDHLANAYGESHAWNAPRTSYDLAAGMYDAGCDIIFQVAGGSGMGIFLAAQKYGRYAIGVDSDQDYLLEGSILTSMMKKVDKGVLFIINEYLDGRLENRNYPLGLAEDGVGLTDMIYTGHLITPEIREYLANLKAGILNQTIPVPSAFPATEGQP